jgi:hypothetical protein
LLSNENKIINEINLSRSNIQNELEKNWNKINKYAK